MSGLAENQKHTQTKKRNEINQINDMIWFNDMNDVLLWYDKW